MASWNETTRYENFDGIRVAFRTVAHGRKDHSVIVWRTYEADVLIPGYATQTLDNGRAPFDAGVRPQVAFQVKAAATFLARSCSNDELTVLAYYAAPGCPDRPAAVTDDVCAAMVKRGLLRYSGVDFDLTMLGLAIVRPMDVNPHA